MIAAPARSTWLRLLVTAAILVYLARGIDMGDAVRAVVHVDAGFLAVVLGLVAIDRGVMIWRWLLLLRASGTPIETKSAAWIYLVSSFVGSFLPAGVGGDALRAYTLGRRTTQNSEAIASVAVDRLLGMLSIVGLGLFGVVVWAGRVDAGLRWTAVLVAVIVAVGSVTVWWADAALRLVLPARWRQTSAGNALARLADALARYRTRRTVLMSVMFLSVAVQLLRVLQAYLLGLGLQIQVPLAYYLVFMPVGLLMLLLPVSVSGFRLPQGVIVWLLRPVGVPDTQSFALSTLIVLTGLIGNLPGALLYLKRKKS